MTCKIDRITNNCMYLVITAAYCSYNHRTVMQSNPDFKIMSKELLSIRSQMIIYYIKHLKTSLDTAEQIPLIVFSINDCHESISHIVVNLPAMLDDNFVHHMEIAMRGICSAVSRLV